MLGGVSLAVDGEERRAMKRKATTNRLEKAMALERECSISALLLVGFAWY